MVGLQKRNHQKGNLSNFHFNTFSIFLVSYGTRFDIFWAVLFLTDMWFAAFATTTTAQNSKIKHGDWEPNIYDIHIRKSYTTYLITLFYSSKIYSHGQDKSDTNRITTRLYFIHFIYLRMRVVMSYSYAH